MRPIYWETYGETSSPQPGGTRTGHCPITVPALTSTGYSLGKPLQQNPLIIHPVYLSSVTMAPVIPGAHATAEAHFELAISADKSNRTASSRAWFSALTMSYEIGQNDSDWPTLGTLRAMVANTGPHYGADVKLDGPGKYMARFKIEPPPYQGFLRHTIEGTGVPQRWSAWSFTLYRAGKKRLLSSHGKQPCQ